MRFVPTALFVGLFVVTHHANSAWNWSGTLRTKMQTDNRYTRYVGKARVFGEVWGSFEAFDNKSWRTSLDFVTREGSRYGLRGDIYQLYVEKQLKAWNTSVKAGRFQRSDSLGFYSLDGADVLYQLLTQGLSLHVYAGKPTRQEDVRSVSGEWLYGLELMSHQQLNWKNKFLPVDTWLMRFSFQQFHNDNLSTRLTLANTLTGQFQQHYLQAYELAFTATLEAETGVFDQVYTSVLVDVTEEIRVRVSYSLYEPKSPFPTFKEQFYSTYYQGRQDVLLISFDQALTKHFSYHIDAKRATRNAGTDIGYGMEVGVKNQSLDNWNLSADFNMVEFGKSSTYNVYFGSEYAVSIKNIVKLNLALSLDKSPLNGENKAIGTELKYRYKICSDVFLDVAGTYIVNSRLNDEYRVGFQATWYFDNFQPKVTM